MSYTTLISSSDLLSHLDAPDWLVVDCRFQLADPFAAEQDYLKSHIAGAVYADLERDLANEIIPDKTGRHPWPTVEQASAALSRLGIGPGVQVVAYDDAGGALAAVRLWWTLRWLGHEAAAVLDGGWKDWLAEGLPVRSGDEHRPARLFTPSQVRPELIVEADEIERMRQDAACLVFDARAANRYMGQNETIDPLAGHIPGAVNAPYTKNLGAGGKMRPTEELRAHYQALLGDIPAHNTAVYCGSGVTSIHNLLAMLHAGLGEGRLYAGSWSEWITDAKRPVWTP